MTSLPPRAACLTPPAVGGIAVIQVAGDGAIALLNRHLRRKNSPVELSQWPAHKLRLCQLVDGPEIIDDAVVSVRIADDATPIIDLNLHGGARIVQRVLLMLQREGARIVEPAELLTTCWPAPSPLHADAMTLLLHAKTRRTAVWLAGLPDRLKARLEAVLGNIERNQTAKAADDLDRLLADADRTARLIHGVTAVLLGRPNSGKSTLANTLAEQEQAIVSDLPGTTRDWTEHPAAIDGVPFTIVDTAGIRHTHDPIEAEAIRRAREQVSRAHVVIRVIDLSQPPEDSQEALVEVGTAGTGEQTPILNVYNKADLPVHAGHAPPASAVQVSARTGRGIQLLRRCLLEHAGLPADAEWPVAPFTPGQVELCRRLRVAVSNANEDRRSAVRELENLVGRVISPGRPADSKV